MKELSIEEKAKAYDEALKKAKEWYDNPNSATVGKAYLFAVFPELKESEDERTRKAILSALNYLETELGWDFIDDVDILDAYAWLEKQGTSAKLSEEEQNRFTKGVLSRCALSFIDYLDAHKYESKMCVSNGECEDIENAFHNTMWDRLHRYYCKYIEKQGEQKHDTDFSDLRTWKYIVDAVWTEKEGIGQYLDSPFTEEVAKKLQKRFGNIEQKPAELFENRSKELSLSLQIQAYLSTASDELYAKGKPLYSEKRIEDIHKCMLMWKKLHNAYFYRKPAWSKEDESILQGIWDEILANKHNAREYEWKTYDKFLNWLESLKERVQPQPKQE